MLSEAINSAFYIYEANFRDLEELNGAGAEGEPAMSVDFLLYDPSDKVRSHSKFRNKGHDAFELNDTGDFCNLTKRLIKPGGHGHALRSAHQFSSWCRRLHSLTEEMEVATDGERDELEINEEEMFDVDRPPQLYTRALSHYQRNPPSKRLNHTSVEKQAVHLWRN